MYKLKSSVKKYISYYHQNMEEGKWEELNMDIVVNVLRRVGMESLVSDVPYVCKSWYKASREPQCWEHLIFPTNVKTDDHIMEEDSPDSRDFARSNNYHQLHNLSSVSSTAFLKFIVNRSCGRATTIKLPNYCTHEALEYVANKCPRLKVLDVGTFNMYIEDIIPNLISNWKSLEMMRVGKFEMKSVVEQIGLHCPNFKWLSAPHTFIGKDEASAIVTSLPNLKYLDLHGASFEKETLEMILVGCRKLLHLDIRDCWGLCGGLDAQTLDLASHIPSFIYQLVHNANPDLDLPYDHIMFMV